MGGRPRCACGCEGRRHIQESLKAEFEMADPSVYGCHGVSGAGEECGGCRGRDRGERVEVGGRSWRRWYSRVPRLTRQLVGLIDFEMR